MILQWKWHSCHQSLKCLQWPLGLDVTLKFIIRLTDILLASDRPFRFLCCFNVSWLTLFSSSCFHISEGHNLCGILRPFILSAKDTFSSSTREGKHPKQMQSYFNKFKSIIAPVKILSTSSVNGEEGLTMETKSNFMQISALSAKLVPSSPQTSSSIGGQYQNGLIVCLSAIEIEKYSGYLSRWGLFCYFRCLIGVVALQYFRSCTCDFCCDFVRHFKRAYIQYMCVYAACFLPLSVWFREHCICSPNAGW